jgi:hypothetical protein
MVLFPRRFPHGSSRLKLARLKQRPSSRPHRLDLMPLPEQLANIVGSAFALAAAQLTSNYPG